MKIPILSVTAYNGNPHIRYCTGQENLQAKSGPEPPPARKIHNSNPLVVLLVLDSTRLDVRIKSQKHDCNGGGTPSETPRNSEEAPRLKRESAKQQIVHQREGPEKRKNGKFV